MGNEISRKEALNVISKFMYLPKPIRKNILRKMIELKLLEIISRDNLKIINIKKSEGIEDKILFFDQLEKHDMNNKGGWFVVMFLSLKYMWESWWL